MDAVRSAFAVFFLQAPSWLVGQRLMEGERGVSNAQTLFLPERIPTDNHVRWLLDPVPPSAPDPAFADLYALLGDDLYSHEPFCRKARADALVAAASSR